MAVGDVYQFISDKALGYETREKYHVYLGKTDHFRAGGEYVFLFISSSNYGNCFPIEFSDYGDFLRYDSYISCGNLIFYSAEDLKTSGAKRVGRISDAHLKALHSHLAGHEIMESWQIIVACNALKEFS
jgi:hypothetical protein